MQNDIIKNTNFIKLYTMFLNTTKTIFYLSSLEYRKQLVNFRPNGHKPIFFNITIQKINYEDSFPQFIPSRMIKFEHKLINFTFHFFKDEFNFFVHNGNIFHCFQSIHSVNHDIQEPDKGYPFYDELQKWLYEHHNRHTLDNKFYKLIDCKKITIKDFYHLIPHTTNTLNSKWYIIDNINKGIESLKEIISNIKNYILYNNNYKQKNLNN